MTARGEVGCQEIGCFAMTAPLKERKQDLGGIEFKS